MSDLWWSETRKCVTAGVLECVTIELIGMGTYYQFPSLPANFRR